MMSSAGSAHTYRSEDAHVHACYSFICCVVYMSVIEVISFPSPGQWEESELEAVHGGADLIVGKRQQVFHREKPLRKPS